MHQNEIAWGWIIDWRFDLDSDVAGGGLTGGWFKKLKMLEDEIAENADLLIYETL